MFTIFADGHDFQPLINYFMVLQILNLDQIGEAPDLWFGIHLMSCIARGGLHDLLHVEPSFSFLFCFEECSIEVVFISQKGKFKLTIQQFCSPRIQTET